MTDPNQFLQDYIASKGNMVQPVDLASVIQIGRPDKFYPGGRKKSEGYYRIPIPLGQPDWSEYDKDVPNPFGGGSDPYFPGV